jgi:hypothetical protein
MSVLLPSLFYLTFKYIVFDYIQQVSWLRVQQLIQIYTITVCHFVLLDPNQQLLEGDIVQGWNSRIGDDICWALENAYLWVMMLQILLALGNKPHTFRGTYTAIQIFFAFTMVLTVWISIAILWQVRSD